MTDACAWLCVCRALPRRWQRSRRLRGAASRKRRRRRGEREVTTGTWERKTRSRVVVCGAPVSTNPTNPYASTEDAPCGSVSARFPIGSAVAALRDSPRRPIPARLEVRNDAAKLAMTTRAPGEDRFASESWREIWCEEQKASLRRVWATSSRTAACTRARRRGCYRLVRPHIWACVRARGGRMVAAPGWDPGAPSLGHLQNISARPKGARFPRLRRQAAKRLPFPARTKTSARGTTSSTSYPARRRRARARTRAPRMGFPPARTRRARCEISPSRNCPTTIPISSRSSA